MEEIANKFLHHPPPQKTKKTEKEEKGKLP